jgi:hypothetical protein
VTTLLAECSYINVRSPICEQQITHAISLNLGVVAYHKNLFFHSHLKPFSNKPNKIYMCIKMNAPNDRNGLTQIICLNLCYALFKKSNNNNNYDKSITKYRGNKYI